ncbi:lipoprotein [Neisseriaceae bacterium TC5R-5]|nr:lipoprotein [Neisseriaceae bacterium TC5R-5]
MRILLLMISLSLLLVACGYKGPLYLPKPEAAAQRTGSAPSNPSLPASAAQ